MHGNNRTTAPEPYAPERYAVAGLKIYQISFFGTNTLSAFPDGQ